MAIIDLTSPPDYLLMETDWAGYEQVLEMVGERHLRVTYDRGKLELMTTSQEHERSKKILGSMVEACLDHLETPYVSLGSSTFKRRLLDRGFEPDEGYWTTQAEALASVEIIDPEQYCPDLIIEIERSRTVLKRLDIFAAFGVPEVWRYTRKRQLKVLRLNVEGLYVEVDESPTLPGIPLTALQEHATRARTLTNYHALRQFRAWLRSVS